MSDRDSVHLGGFARANGNRYVVRAAPNVAGFRVYRDQDGGRGYLLGSVDDPESDTPQLKVHAGRLVSTGGAEEVVALALDVWRRGSGGAS